MNNSELKKIRYSGTCSLCNGKVKLLDRNYTHILSDGTLCQKCDMALSQFLSERNSWIDKDEYISVMEKNYSPHNEHGMPLKKAQALLKLRDTVCDRFLKTIELDSGDVFVAQEVFQMPKSPAIFILRAIKVKNKAVLQGFSLKGEIRKGDNVTLNINGNLQTIKALDVIQNGTDAFNKSSFFDLLSTNVHNHKIKEAKLGWIIIDTEDIEGIKKDGFVAILPKK